MQDVVEMCYLTSRSLIGPVRRVTGVIRSFLGTSRTNYQYNPNSMQARGMYIAFAVDLLLANQHPCVAKIP